MAHQAYAAYHQQHNRGTLPPGHTIVVNKYTVQVERYLSQGGFAHVYVVRTANPINNTTQHVLKRIAVADEAMLGEVKKEVDIMRFLRGHPNIVNLIDASWNKLPNGTYEVFILMELCSGGGIIDMMNRRLRERLTEAEILQIFVDVCEAVAAMHNLKPPLLHRDLKVENILQSSLTRYKLCDFGSSTPVAPRPPSTTQEIRALEADLNRHTTLQYRAPEMVDVYLRRPVDEKSDVWALGVLLYKLCYYTTPFEEHGPLAILNVQYRIPPYPVYSAQMNSLIGSMLRELGAQRPSVFEILNLVHHMRGSKSPYRYNIPAQQSLRPPPQKPPQSGLDDIVAFRSSPSPNATSNAATQARQKVLDAIAPMRRGRPTASSISGPSSIQGEEKDSDIPAFEKQWNIAKVESGEGIDDAWAIGETKAKDKGKSNFGDGFVGFGDSFTDPNLEKPMSPPAPSPSPAAPKPRPTGMLDVKKDAFEGLGISRSREPSPTLAEVSDRKSRLGLNESARPPALSGVSRSPVSLSTATPLSPRIPASRTGLATHRPPTSLTPEERFPSLDDLDKGWQFPSTLPPATSKPEFPTKSIPLPQKPVGVSQPSLVNPTIGPRPSEPKPFAAPLRGETRSQQVTGTAMRSGQAEIASATQPTLPTRPSGSLDPIEKRQMPIGSSPTKYRPSRPALARKHRSSMSIKYTEPRSPPPDWLTGADPVMASSPLESPPSPVRKRASPNLLTPARDGIQSAVDDVSHSPAIRYKQDIKPTQEEVSSSVSSTQQEDAISKSPFKQRRAHQSSAPPRQESSSDDAEGPDDVNNRVITDDIRRKRAKGRQSSVHDLVDLYGGGGRASVERERTGPPSPVVGRQGRRTSGILVDLSLPSSAASQSTLLSPATIIPESRAELATRRTGSGSQEERTSSPTSLLDSYEHISRPASRTSPIPSATDRTERPRPQSMFMFPPPKPLDSASNSGASPGARSRHSARRGSISDMVDLYENLGGGSRLKDPPPIASKPAGLKLNKTPSPITSRFPAVSPTGLSFSINQATNVLADLSKVKPKPRRSPTTESFDERVSPGLSTMQDNRNDFISRVPRRQSISPAKPTPASVKLTPVSATSSPPKPVKPPISIPIPARNAASSTPGQRTPVTDTPISSPSPERPYQGVGKLIDQWQKKTEEADASRHPGPRSTGRPLGPRAVGRAR